MLFFPGRFISHPKNVIAQEGLFETFECSVKNCMSTITWKVGNMTSGDIKAHRGNAFCNEHNNKKSTLTLLASMDMNGTPVQCEENKYGVALPFYSKFAVLVVTAQESE